MDTPISKTDQKATGVTLIEGMLFLGLTLLLAAVAVPAIKSAYRDSQRTQCPGGLKQIGISLHAAHAVESVDETQ